MLVLDFGEFNINSASRQETTSTKSDESVSFHNHQFYSLSVNLLIIYLMNVWLLSVSLLLDLLSDLLSTFILNINPSLLTSPESVSLTITITLLLFDCIHAFTA